MLKTYIGESVRLINDMLEYADKNNIEAILFSADFEKAFDSIDHTFILAVLKSYGFGPEFFQWVKTFLNNAESCVMNRPDISTPKGNTTRLSSVSIFVHSCIRSHAY